MKITHVKLRGTNARPLGAGAGVELLDHTRGVLVRRSQRTVLIPWAAIAEVGVVEEQDGSEKQRTK